MVAGDGVAGAPGAAGVADPGALCVEVSAAGVIGVAGAAIGVVLVLVGVAGSGADPPQAATPSAAVANPKIFSRSVISIGVSSSRIPKIACPFLAESARSVPTFGSYYEHGSDSVLKFLSGFFPRTAREASLTIQVLYFAAIRDLVGKSQETMELSPGVTTVGALRAYLEHTVPTLAGRLDAVRWAKNEVFVGMEASIDEGDVVALIPPVAGG
jgi:molybdopterin converting factor subunit 1